MSRESLPVKDDVVRADTRLKILISLVGKNNVNKIREEIERLFQENVGISSWKENMKKEVDIMVKSTEGEEIRRIENIVSSMKIGGVPRAGTNYVVVKKQLNGYYTSGGKRGPKIKNVPEGEPKKKRVYGLVEVGLVNREDNERFFQISNEGLMRVVTFLLESKIRKPENEMSVEW